ncbi:hypothetical protein SDJN03_07406, partial [Cucurbita argyrosperma subsp. sororia]
MGSLLLASHLLSLLIAFLLSLHLPSQLAAAAHYNIHPYQYQPPPPSSPPPPPEKLSSPPPPKTQYKLRSLLQRRMPRIRPWPRRATRKSPPPPF